MYNNDIFVLAGRKYEIYFLKTQRYTEWYKVERTFLGTVERIKMVSLRQGVRVSREALVRRRGASNSRQR